MNIKDFYYGWFIGNFEPSLLKQDQVEIGYLQIKKGTKGDGHFHKYHTEINLIINGIAKIGDEYYGRGDFFIFKPGNKNSDLEYLEDTDLIVIKSPHVKGDKFYD